MIAPRPPIVTIGVDEDVVARIRAKVERPVIAYPVPPPIEVRDGVTRVESARVAGKMIETAGVVWHGYFGDAADVRRMLALSSTPTFPDIRATMPLDDRFVSLAMATRVDRVEEPRGVLLPNQDIELSSERVAKWGHRHCGDGKERVNDRFTASELTLLEPFVEGTSERVLLIGEAAWQLRYESDDWRKNVRARVTPVDPANRRLVARARKIAEGLGLPMVGVDFIVRDDDAVLLEVNAYPGMDDAPGAVDAFVDAIADWAVNLETFKHAARARWLASTTEYRPTPAELTAISKLEDHGERIVRAGTMRARTIQLVILESFGDFSSYEFGGVDGSFHVGRVQFRRKQDVDALRRAPARALAPVVPTTDRDVAELPSDIGRAWSARIASLQIRPFERKSVVFDGTRCELLLDSIKLDWICEAPPAEWQPLQRFAEELVAMVNQHVDARSGSPT